MQNSNAEVTRGGTSALDYGKVKRDIAARLKNSCGDWPREEFEAIVEKVTLTTLKFPPPRLRHSD